MFSNTSPFRIITIFILCFWLSNTNAQITEVKYMIKFNEVNQYYDCYLVILKGSASSIQLRTQLSAQFSIVVPTGSDVNIVQNYMPVQGNQNYTGTIPCLWTLGNQILHPAVQPLSDFYGITPSLVPACQYNNLMEGDSIKLFSLSIVIPGPACKSHIRLFQNGIDPGAAAPGMGGGDFNNGFTIGNPTQRYKGNLPGYLPSDKVSNSQDAGFGTLRKAVACALNNDPIFVEDSLTGKYIQLLSPIVIDKNINLHRSASSTFTIKAPQNGPAFVVTQDNSLNISNVNFISGNNQSLSGRLFVNNGTLTLEEVNLKDPNIHILTAGSTINNQGQLFISGSVSLVE